MFAPRSLTCDCNLPNVPAWVWVRGSALQVRGAVNANTVTREFNATLHSKEGTHTDGTIANRPHWVPVLTTQVSYAYTATPIAPLRCNPLSRGEDSVLFRTFFFTRGGMPLLGPGVFVETGAHDGIVDSATLFFEKCLGWEGVLIEPHPLVWPQLLRSSRKRSIMKQSAICARNGTAFIDRGPHTPARTHEWPIDEAIPVPCAPLSDLLWSIGAVRRTGRVDLLSLDVEGAEPVAVASLGHHISFGVVMAEVTAGARRVKTMQTMLGRGFDYVGQISARPSPANYVISDVFYNRSHFAHYWPLSRALSR